MQSTDVDRTLQSGYSELLGLYPPSSAKGAELSAGEQKSLESGRGLPRIKIRDAASINQKLGASTLPNGFVSVPISTFADKNIQDDVSYGGCPYS